MKLTLKGTQRYWFHRELISIIGERTSWEEQKIKDFLIKNEVVYFNDLQESDARHILERLETSGFEIQLDQAKAEIVASLALPYEKELESLKKEFSEVSLRLDHLEKVKGIKKISSSIKESLIYQRLSKEVQEPVRQTVPAPIRPIRSEEVPSRTTTESNIGKYWLSRIGIFTLVLGVAFFLSYTFQHLGALGKIFIGLVLGTSLAVWGNFLARSASLYKWAMGIIAGGWAIIYSTVFAAYHIPETKVIQNPIVAFLCLLPTIVLSINQALRHRSPTLVFYSYFLAFVSMATGEVTPYTLAASLVLGISTVFVARRFGWNWLALLACFALYVTHWFWIEPSLIHNYLQETSLDRFIEVFFMPWFQSRSLAPIVAIESSRSILHQLFLISYWALFTTIGFFKQTEDQEKENKWISFWLLFVNGFIFTNVYLYHLHFYYPAFKYVFSLSMSCVYLVLSRLERNARKDLLSDLYLAFSIAMLAFTIPMYFDGAHITYGWMIYAAVLAWFGTFYGRKVITWASRVISFCVLFRLLAFDRFESEALFSLATGTVPYSVLIFTVVAFTFFLIFLFYRRSQVLPENEKRISENIYAIASLWTFGYGIYVDAFQNILSFLWVLEGLASLKLGLALDRRSFKWSSWLVSGVVILRLLTHDLSESQVFFHLGWDVVHYSFLRFTLVAIVFALMFFLYWEAKHISQDEKRICENIYAIASLWTFGIGAYVGGFNSTISLIWMIEGCFSFMVGFWLLRQSSRISAFVLIVLATLRLLFLDLSYDFMRFTMDAYTAFRVVISIVSIAILFAFVEWLRRRLEKQKGELWEYFSVFTYIGAGLLLRFFYQSSISSWISGAWGILALLFLIFGFSLRQAVYRWSGLGIFAVVLLRLFFHDFSKLEPIYRIISFIGLGAIFIAASFIYSCFSKIFLGSAKEPSETRRLT